MSPEIRHRPWEDVLALLVGTTLVALGVQFLGAGGLITGQIAGLALIGAHLTPYSFGAVFFALNLPFYVLAVLRMGWLFTVKTFTAVTLVSVFSEALARSVDLSAVPMPLAAALAGVQIGAGMLVLFRHGASLGGVGIVALMVQERTGFRAGNVQLIVDLGVFALAAALFPLVQVGWSLLGAVILNLIIAMNHRRDRYIAM